MFRSLVCLTLVAAVIATGCVFQDVRVQQSKLETFCKIDGSVSAAQETSSPLLVGLVRHDGGVLDDSRNWSLVDHFVLDAPGRWMFRAGPGTYGLVAFVDSNADGVYQHSEPFLAVDPNRLVTCDDGHRHAEVTLSIPADGRPRLKGEIELRPITTNIGPQVEGRFTGHINLWNAETKTYDETGEAVELPLSSEVGKFEIDQKIYADRQRSIKIPIVGESEDGRPQRAGVLRGTIPRPIGNWLAVPSSG